MTNNFVIDVIESELYKVKGMKPHMKQVATDILAYLMLSVHSFKKQLAHPMEGK